MQQYVLGFHFYKPKSEDDEFTEVALIRKTRPEWQAGKWNGIGGKVEENENIYVAQSREFLEETGVNIGPNSWELHGIMEGNDYQIFIFSHFSDKQVDLKPVTDEVPDYFNVNELHEFNCVPNVHWLVPFLLSPSAKNHWLRLRDIG
jgi:8-oxo-dGTP diphosphatase